MLIREHVCAKSPKHNLLQSKEWTHRRVMLRPPQSPQSLTTCACLQPARHTLPTDSITFYNQLSCFSPVQKIGCQREFCFIKNQKELSIINFWMKYQLKSTSYYQGTKNRKPQMGCIVIFQKIKIKKFYFLGGFEDLKHHLRLLINHTLGSILNRTLLFPLV